MFVAGAFMIIIGLGMTGRFPWAARLTPAPPKFLITALSRTRRKANKNAEEGHTSLATPITLGLLTGFFPCAPLMSAQLTAAASGSALNGALVMFAFGLGTAPLMLGFGTASSLLPARLKERVMLLLAVVVMVFGLVYINRGLMLTGSPITGNSIRQSVLGTGGDTPASASTEYPRGADGVVEIPLAIVNTTFQPQNISIPADEPVRLIVDRQEDNACSDQLAVPQMNVLVDLAPFDTTIVELPAAKAGTYTLTCGMGMMSGSINVGGAAASGPSALPLVVLVLGLGVAGAVWYVRSKKAPQPAPGKKKAAAADSGPKLILGAKPQELLIFGGVVGFAIFAGLLLGGFFGN